MSKHFDRSYKRLFGFREVVQALAEGYLEGDWAESVRWETLRKGPTCHVSSSLVQRENDLIFRVNR